MQGELSGARNGIPDFDVRISRRDQLAIRRDGDRMDNGVVAAERGAFLSTIEIPDLDCSVRASADKLPAVRRESQIGDATFVSDKRLSEDPTGRVPHADDVVVPARSQQPTVGRKGDHEQPAGVHGERDVFLAPNDVPKFCGVVRTRRGERFTVWAERHGVDAFRVPLENRPFRDRLCRRLRSPAAGIRRIERTDLPEPHGAVLLPEARNRPSGEKASDSTKSLWPVNVISSWPLTGSQSLMVVSSLPEARSFPFGEKTTGVRTSLCPSKVRAVDPRRGPTAERPGPCRLRPRACRRG